MVNLNRKIERDTKREIFKRAKEASDRLLLWNHPNKKNSLSPWDRKEVENLLWYHNKLDSLIHDRLGENGWNKFSVGKLSNEDYNTLFIETRNLTVFLNSLEPDKN